MPSRGHVDTDAIDLYEVKTPSGRTLRLLTEEEADFYNDHRDKYIKEYRLENASDLQTVEVILTMEVMVSRWSMWLTQGFDYDEGVINAEELRRNIQQYCVDEETEIFTREGFKRFTDLIPGEPILTLNANTGCTEWQEVRNMFIGQANDKMLSLESRDHSSLTTADHRWFISNVTKDNATAKTEWRNSSELDAYSAIPTFAPYAEAEREQKFSDDFVTLMAYYWTEGHIDKRCAQVTIGQSWRANPGKVATLRRVLRSEFGVPANEGQRVHPKSGPFWKENVTEEDGMVRFKLSSSIGEVLDKFAPKKVLHPSFYLHLTTAQLRLFVETSIDADGSRSRWNATLAQRERARVEAFQTVCVLDGRQTSLNEAKSGMWVLTIQSGRYSAPLRAARKGKGATAEWVEYDGIIWCPVVDNSTWLARRNGRCYFTGNSLEIRNNKVSLGIDRVTRQKDKGEDIASYLENLRQRALAFGIKRSNEAARAIELFKEAENRFGLILRTDKEEQEYLRIDALSVYKWFMEEAVPEMNKIDQEFIKTGQRFWIKEI